MLVETTHLTQDEYCILLADVRAFTFVLSWSYRAMTVALTVSFKLISF